MLRFLTKLARPFCESKKQYIYPYNINMEQNRKYIQRVNKEL
jgi:hypothetical protein